VPARKLGISPGIERKEEKNKYKSLNSESIFKSSKMPFLALPNELILKITRGYSPPEVNALLRANRQLSELLSTTLVNSIFRSRSGRYGREALYSFAQAGDIEAIHNLLDRGVLKLDGNACLLNHAVLNQSTEVVSILVKCGVSATTKDIEDRTPLALAAMNGNKGMVDTLLAKVGGDYDQVNSKDRARETPLHLAAKSGHSDVVELLLRNQKIFVDATNRHGLTPLIIAAKNNHEVVLRLLLSGDRANVYACDPCMRTSLHEAADNGNANIARALLERMTIDRSPKDGDGETPMHAAARFERLEIIQVFLNAGDIDPNIQDGRMRTPLYIAADHGYPSVIKLLLDLNLTEPNIADNESKTPLHKAAERGLELVAKMLCNYRRTNIELQDKDGCTPLDIASHKGHWSVVQVLAECAKRRAITAATQASSLTANLTTRQSGVTVIVPFSAPVIRRPNRNW